MFRRVDGSPMKRLLTSLVAVLAVAAFAAAGASADESFEDPVFDAPSGVPDITTVAVANTTEGVVTFQITIDNFEALPQPPGSRAHLSVAFDLDKNPATGDVGGEEAVAVFANILANNGAVDLWRWDGSQMVDAPETNTSSSLSGGVLTLTTSRSELLDVTSLAFRIEALTVVDGAGSPRFDFAPDDGWWTYDLVPALAPPRPTLSATKPVGTPRRPVAGRTFTVRSVVTRSDTGGAVTAGLVRCTARVATARLRVQGRFRAGRAQCVVAVPPKAKGKTLRGSITVSAAGASVSKPYSFRVV